MGNKARLEALAKEFNIPFDDLEHRAGRIKHRLGSLVTEDLAERLLDGKIRIEHLIAKGGKHIAGLDIADAVDVASKEASHGKLFTLGYWARPGESPNSDRLPIFDGSGCDSERQAIRLDLD